MLTIPLALFHVEEFYNGNEYAIVFREEWDQFWGSGNHWKYALPLFGLQIVLDLIDPITDFADELESYSLETH